MVAKFEDLFSKERGTLILGGSRALGEAGIYSDEDNYFITNSVRGMFALIKNKELILQAKKNYIIIPKIFLRWKFYYVHGRKEDGAIYTAKYDPILIRNNSLKLAYRELGAAAFAREESLEKESPGKIAYHLSKALLHAIYAKILFENKDAFGQECPLFSARRLMNYVKKQKEIDEIDTCLKILRWKIEDLSGRATQEDQQFVSEVLESVYQKFLQCSFSWRSYLLYNFFSLKHGSFNYVFKNPDTHIINQFRRALAENSRALFEHTRKDTFKMIII